MLSAPSGIAFDLDGTLVDSLVDLTSSANHVRLGRSLPPLSAEVIRTYIGNGARKLVQRALDLRDDESSAIDDALHEFRAHYKEHCLDQTRPYPGVRDTLAKLIPLPLAVVTNKPQPFADLVVEGLGLRSFFAAVVGARAGMPVKPAADLVTFAYQQLGVEPTRGWMVGDSVNDLQAGRAAGCEVVMVTYGLGRLSRSQTASADALIDSFQELLHLVRP